MENRGQHKKFRIWSIDKNLSGQWSLIWKMEHRVWLMACGVQIIDYGEGRMKIKVWNLEYEVEDKAWYLYYEEWSQEMEHKI